jgi:pimeloyl-ACP methyl ester carboxylesterase
MESEPMHVRRSDRVTLVGERRGRRGAPAVVFLHANVVDRRSWHAVFDALGDEFDLIAYDRRGFGETPPADPEEPFTHLDDLVAVLDEAGVDRAVIVGNSMGGAVALDLAASAPQRVAAVLLLAGGASGMTDEGEDVTYELDPVTTEVVEALDRAETAGDVDEQVRLNLHLWLDGPTQPEGRVSGPARELAAEMNRRVLTVGAPDDAGDSRLDTWHDLGSIDVPVLAAWGDLDIPADHHWYGVIAERLPRATSRVLQGSAHLPSLDQPEAVAALVREAVGSVES